MAEGGTLQTREMERGTNLAGRAQRHHRSISPPGSSPRPSSSFPASSHGSGSTQSSLWEEKWLPLECSSAPLMASPLHSRCSASCLSSGAKLSRAWIQLSGTSSRSCSLQVSHMKHAATFTQPCTKTTSKTAGLGQWFVFYPINTAGKASCQPLTSHRQPCPAPCCFHMLVGAHSSAYWLSGSTGPDPRRRCPGDSCSADQG